VAIIGSVTFPKIELHVHLEGTIRARALLRIARRNGVPLPADSVEGLAARIRDVAKRARAGQLTADDVLGGTFTITNPDQYGSIMATPVINQPQVAILDFEATVKRPVVIDDAIAIRPITILGMSWDHRALDGALAAQFLGSLRGRLESVT